ncbi:mitochondrial carrier, partial [Cantharellus anzutake]|uniref:mitochondrial carrier n=1 Tax=Cantharellus anzutake TaxID=1750568 RepID=UPI0019088F3A
AGAAAGTSVDLLFFPIDTVKTRLQSSQGFLAAGGFRGVYRGIGSVIVGSAPGAAVFFTTYDYLKHNLPSPISHPSPLAHVFAASMGECAACLVRVPTEVVKSRTQTSTYGVAASSFDTFMNVMRADGVAGLYRGFGITIMREARSIPFTSLQFPLYEYLKRSLRERLPGKRVLHAYEASLCGSVAGGVAAALTTPLDVLKTRVMLDMRADRSEIPSITHRFRSIYRVEGVGALFAGVVPRTFWISAGGAVFLGVYELAVSSKLARGL